ncbi:MULTISPECIES: MFS transporter [unclassified Delftia]|uniref:MFS transporter n=1 Tax=unclassified Delftia TaxID=2613839 RepID=UPI002D7F6C8D|nr:MULTISPECIES: MFS transporter [unclassified Delftia]
MQTRWPPYAWVCFSMCVGVMGTALASPLYPLYQQAWGLQPSHITQIFVAYMFGALASLLFLGRLTDRFGFVTVLRAGLILMTLGVLASAVAWNVPSFALGRVVIGVASGLITTSASVGMTRLNNRGDLQRAAATTSLTIAFGFGLGPVVGGLIAQWLPWPLVTAYIPSLGLGLLAVYALYQVRIAEPAELASTQARALHWRDFMPTITLPERRFARHYALGGMCAFCAFGMFSLFASLAPSFMQRMVPWHGPAVSGLSIGVILFLSAGFQYLARPRPTKGSAIVGFACLVACNLLLLINSFAGSALLFALSVITTAAGHGLCNLAGMSIVNKVSTPATRTGLLSTYLVVGYLGTIVPILGLGWLSDHIGITEALVAYCIVMGALAGWLCWMCTRTPTLPMPKH